MMPMSTHPARFLRACAALLVAVGLSACGSRLEYRPPISYTADTLAQEFLSSYGDLKPKKPGGSTARSPKPKLRPEALAKEAAKGDPQTKQAEGATLDELIAETLRKAAEIPGTSRADACRKVVEVVTKDPSVSEGDKKIIAEKLGSGAD
jgi:hypothetical protein